METGKVCAAQTHILEVAITDRVDDRSNYSLLIFRAKTNLRQEFENCYSLEQTLDYAQGLEPSDNSANEPVRSWMPRGIHRPRTSGKWSLIYCWN